MFYCGHRYFAKAIILPLFTCGGVYICIPIWNKLRQLAGDRIETAVWKIGPIHSRRALVNVFMFCFAPLTRSSIEALTCVETCTDVDDDDVADSPCVPVLKQDMAVQCWRDDHIFTACFAATLLVVVAVAVPIQLLRIVRRAREQRDASLRLRAEDADRWFDELDDDNSGALEGEEIKELHRRMGGTLNLATLDPDGDGEVTKQEFNDWYHGQLAAVADSPFDVLYGTTTAAGYWWTCYFLLWLKTAINVLYTYGSARQLEWHIWMHMLLVTSMFMLTYQVPYVADLDHHVAQLALGSLAGVAHISSIFKAGTTWDPAYVVLTALLFLLPLLAFVGEKAFAKLRAKSRVKKMADQPEGAPTDERKVPELQNAKESCISTVASELFERMDRTGDGLVSRAELIDALRNDTELQYRLNLPTRPGDTQLEDFERAFQSMRPTINIDELVTFLEGHIPRAALRMELEQVTKLSLLKKRALADGVGEVEIEHAEDSESPRESLIELIVAAAPAIKHGTPSRPPAALRHQTTRVSGSSTPTRSVASVAQQETEPFIPLTLSTQGKLVSLA